MHSSTIRTGFLFSLFAFGLGHLHAQTIRIPVAKRKAQVKNTNSARRSCTSATAACAFCRNFDNTQ